MTRADNRPRVHIFPNGPHMTVGSCRWSIGPTGHQREEDSAGAALDAAIARLGQFGEIVVIIEPVP